MDEQHIVSYALYYLPFLKKSTSCIIQNAGYFLANWSFRNPQPVPARNLIVGFWISFLLHSSRHDTTH